MSSVNGNVVLITGAARGIGAEVVWDKCADAFVKGIGGRKRRVHCHRTRAVDQRAQRALEWQ